MTKIKDLHKTWMKDATYREEYEALEEEFTVVAAIAKARRRAGLSQAELARRMKTTQSTVARLESDAASPLRARCCGSQKRRDISSRSVFSR